jgi:hypothetical protein
MAKNGFSYMTKRSGDIHKISHDLLHNQYVLYLIFFIAVGNLFLFIFSNDLMSAGVFFTAGLLTSFFSKNMVVIMVTAMVVANIIRMGLTNNREGFADEEEEEFKNGDNDDDDDDNFKTREDDDDDDNFKNVDDDDEDNFKNPEDDDEDDKD